jgi:Acetyltransferase (GNAT) domain
MDLRIVNPGSVPDWDGLLRRGNDHEFFHTSAWARVLESTYGFRPIYHVRIEGDRAVFVLPLMEVRSWMTGRRGVSLPFTDHCPPHDPGRAGWPGLVERLREYGRQNGWRYVEWRDGRSFEEGIPTWESFWTHEIDLRRPEQAVFASLSENNRRNIRKGQKEGVTVEVDQTLESVRGFYKLNLMTRQRHGLPPQPFRFFRSVFEHILSKDQGFVVSARYRGRLVAASVFFHTDRKAIYKYGASDLRYQGVRPNNLVMWEALRRYRDRGVEALDLGRTELSNPGLLQFKRTWGAAEGTIHYHRYDLRAMTFVSKDGGHGGRFERIFSRTPTPLLRVLGSLLYKHVG